MWAIRRSSTHRRVTNAHPESRHHRFGPTKITRAARSRAIGNGTELAITFGTVLVNPEVVVQTINSLAQGIVLVVLLTAFGALLFRKSAVR